MAISVDPLGMKAAQEREATNFDRQAVHITADAIVRVVINKERKRQDEKFGPLPRDISWGTWLAVLGEEFGEVSKEIVEWDRNGNLLTELSHVAAVAEAWMTDIMLKWEGRDEPTDGSGS